MCCNMIIHTEICKTNILFNILKCISRTVFPYDTCHTILQATVCQTIIPWTMGEQNEIIIKPF